MKLCLEEELNICLINTRGDIANGNDVLVTDYAPYEVEGIGGDSFLPFGFVDVPASPHFVLFEVS